jgi:hypothetical protein
MSRSAPRVMCWSAGHASLTTGTIRAESAPLGCSDICPTSGMPRRHCSTHPPATRATSARCSTGKRFIARKSRIPSAGDSAASTSLPLLRSPSLRRRSYLKRATARNMAAVLLEPPPLPAVPAARNSSSTETIETRSRGRSIVVVKCWSAMKKAYAGRRKAAEDASGAAAAAGTDVGGCAAEPTLRLTYRRCRCL